MRLKCLLLICSLAMLSWAQPVTQTEAYRRWTQLPSDSLINMGSRFAELQNHPDSGLVCFTIAASRFKPSMTRAQKRQCAQGYIGKWYVYFFCYYDHSQAFENLLHAQEITESIGEGLGRVYLNFGATYQTLSEQSGELRPDSLALDYYRQIRWLAVETGAESVFGTGPTPGVERSNVPLTTRGQDIWYAHVLPDFKRQVSVKTDRDPASLTLLRTGEAVPYIYRDGFLVFQLAADRRTATDDVVKIVF